MYAIRSYYVTTNVADESSLQDLMDAGQLTAIWQLVQAEAARHQKKSESGRASYNFV